MPTERILYIMNKPPVTLLPHFARCRTMFDIGNDYGLDRLHSTYLRLGQSTPESIRAALRALEAFREEPFRVTFDWIRGNLLQSRRTQPSPSAFQRSLARHMTRLGASVIPHPFWLHLSLGYGKPPEQETAVSPISWTVDEILLIESVHGEGRHVTHGRWSLRARQHCFPF